jgi:transcriptional regulator with XRE-family HTH domain
VKFRPKPPAIPRPAPSALREIRVRYRLKLRELSEATGLSMGIISSIENGFVKLSDKSAAAFIEGYRKLRIDVEKIVLRELRLQRGGV